MNSVTIKDIASSVDRHKIYTFQCNPSGLEASIASIRSENITVINIGKEVALFLDLLDDYAYLSIEVQDFLNKILEKNKRKIINSGNDIVAIYNLGILFEPRLELYANQLLKDISKTIALIILWENQSELTDRLHWPTQQNYVFLDFSDAQLKKLQYAI
ncbi:MAG: hypothetical protein Q8L68_01815 [Methylococcales bacterium]|nr:hypothetical protein [Methylococcales bacterium]